MRVYFLLMSFLMMSLMISCTKPSKSVAAQYKDKLSGGGSANQDPTPPSDDPPSDDPPSDDPPSDDPPMDEEAAGGDAEEGAKLLATCGGCHPGNGVKLDKSAVSKLDAAYTGAQKQIHGGFSEQFEDKRADLEAAMNAK
jgi:hypothetical protein